MREQEMPLLRIGPDRRHLVTECGKQFFWMGDTAWELFHRLTPEEAGHYLDCRAEQGFTVIQAASRGASHAFFYTPNGLAIKVRMGVLPGRQVRVAWYNPRTGETTDIGLCENEGESVLRPVTAGRGEDWVLVLDALV